MTDWQVIDGNITAPKGFKASGITAGLKPSGAPDLALIYSDTEAIAAGVFTTSQVRAACVDYCRQRLQSKASARAVLVNAGQANAGTGKQGWDDAVECAELVGEALNLSSESVLLASTGVIGQRIKMDILRQGIPQLVSELSETGGDAASKSIITTDLVPKAIGNDSPQYGYYVSLHYL
jgi:glutamate N-acetyltransferase/amino-acid N-acetyltransferase